MTHIENCHGCSALCNYVGKWNTKHVPGGIMACSNRWNKNLCFDVDVCWLLCTPGQVQPRSHLAYLIYTSGSTGTPKGCHCLTTNVNGGAEIGVLSDKHCAQMRIFLCCDRHDYHYFPYTILFRQMKPRMSCFHHREEFECHRAVSAMCKKRRRTSGEHSGVGLRYEGRVVGFTFRWTINHCCRFHNGWLGPLFFTDWYYRLEKWNCGTIQLLSNLCNRKPECWSGPG